MQKRKGEYNVLHPRILALMFHRVNDQSHAQHPAQFERFLQYLIDHFSIVSPNETPTTALSVCLTFDDAYYDFYHNVYPLLKKYRLSALLAVPTKYIVEQTNVPAAKRLSVPYPQGMETDDYHQLTPFCTWEELKEMAQSPHVVIASHSHSHANCQKNDLDIAQELLFSKTQLEKKLQVPITHFVYPFGKMHKPIHQKVCQYYDCGWRIGNALNLGWTHPARLRYRVNADQYWMRSLPFSAFPLSRLYFNYWLNRLRCV